MSKTELSISGELPQSISTAELELMLSRILEAWGDDDTYYQVSLSLVDSAQMRHINRIHRGLDATTDVLSFEGEKLLLHDSDTTRYMRLCDIVIDTNQVFKQKGANTYTEEFWQVLIHGILHIAGFDHIKTDDKKKMEDAEENYRTIIREGTRRG